jgi:DNA-binding beta-propeller fold protein YncE
MRVLPKTVFITLIAFGLMAEVGCGDQYRPVANPVISPGGQPQSNHFAWVVNNNPRGDGSTTEIDVSGDTNLAVNAMGKGTSAEAFPTNSLSLYVANAGDDTVMQYLPTLSGAITTISLLPGSHPIALNSSLNTSMYVLNSGTNSDCQNKGSISTITTATLSVSNTTCVGVDPIAMVQGPNGGYIYIINKGDNSLTVFNPAGPTVVTTLTETNGLGPNPVALAVTPQGWICIVTQGDGTPAHPPTLNLILSGYDYIAANAPLGALPNYAFVDPNRNRLYVTNGGDNTVSVFDSSSINPSGNPQIPLLGTAKVGTDPIGVTVLLDGSNFFTANAGSNDVSVVSQNSFSLLTAVTLPTGANPVFIASDPTSQRVYVADQGTFETTIIQTSNNTISGSIAAPTQVFGCTSNCALQTPLMIVTQ